VCYCIKRRPAKRRSRYSSFPLNVVPAKCRPAKRRSRETTIFLPRVQSFMMKIMAKQKYLKEPFVIDDKDVNNASSEDLCLDSVNIEEAPSSTLSGSSTSHKSWPPKKIRHYSAVDAWSSMPYPKMDKIYVTTQLQVLPATLCKVDIPVSPEGEYLTLLTWFEYSTGHKQFITPTNEYAVNLGVSPSHTNY